MYSATSATPSADQMRRESSRRGVTPLIAFKRTASTPCSLLAVWDNLNREGLVSRFAVSFCSAPGFSQVSLLEPPRCRSVHEAPTLSWMCCWPSSCRRWASSSSLDSGRSFGSVWC